MRRLVVRADATARIGTGHVMRCLSLASAASSWFDNIVFACAATTPATAARIAAAGHRLVSLPAPVGGAEDLRATRALAAQAAAVVLDGYAFDAGYRQAVRAVGKPVLALDDLGDTDLFAELVVNPSPAADPALYTRRSPGAGLLLGPSYALVNPRLLPWRQAVAGDRLLLSFGGSDPLGLTVPVARALRAALPQAPLCAVVGGSTPNADQVAKEITALGGQALVDVADMGPVLRGCRLAVSAAGSTMYELATLERPMLLVVVADNQRAAARGAAMQGWAETLESVTPDTIAAQAAVLWRSPATLASLAAEASARVDGRGGERITAALAGLTASASR